VPAHAGSPTYTLLSGTDGLERAGTIWTELEDSCEASYFQTYALARAWYETLGPRVKARPQIVVLHENGTPVGLLPGCLTHVRGIQVITWMGLPDALDSGDVLFDARKASLPAGEFVREAVTLLKRANRLRPVLLSNVCADAIAYPPLDASFRQYRHGVIPVVTADCAPGSYEQTWSPSLRKSIRRRRNVLTREGGYRIETTELDDAASFEQLRHLCNLKIRQRKGAGLQLDLIDDDYFAFIRRQTQLGAAGVLSTLVFRDRVIAGMYDVVRGNTRYSVLLAFDPEYAAYSPGLVLGSHVVRDWICAGVTRTYNLGWGSDAYKYHWRPTEMPLTTFVDKGVAGTAILAAVRLRDLAAKTMRPHEAARRTARKPAPQDA